MYLPVRVFRVFAIANSLAPSVGKSFYDLRPRVLKLRSDLDLNWYVTFGDNYMYGAIAKSRVCAPVSYFRISADTSVKAQIASRALS